MGNNLLIQLDTTFQEGDDDDPSQEEDAVRILLDALALILSVVIIVILRTVVKIAMFAIVAPEAFYSPRNYFGGEADEEEPISGGGESLQRQRCEAAIRQALPTRQIRSTIPDDVSYYAGDNSSCDICLNDYRIGDKVSSSLNPECTHAFHQDCIVRWLMMQSSASSSSANPHCPICRRDYLANDKNDNDKSQPGTGQHADEQAIIESSQPQEYDEESALEDI